MCQVVCSLSQSFSPWKSEFDPIFAFSMLVPKHKGQPLSPAWAEHDNEYSWAQAEAEHTKTLFLRLVNYAQLLADPDAVSNDGVANVSQDEDLTSYSQCL